MGYDYFYNTSNVEFNFLRLPTKLMDSEEFENLSLEASVLYALFVDRLSLSVKNGWFDDENRVYIIFPIDEIARKLKCKRDKAMKVIAELDSNKGIGLIERKKQGAGKPDIIFVKNIITEENTKNSTGTDEKVKAKSEVGNADFTLIKIPFEAEKIDFLKSQMPTYEVGNVDSIYKEYINTNITNIIPKDKNNNIYPNHINHNTNDMNDANINYDYNTALKIIKNNISYESLISDETIDHNVLENLINIMADVISGSSRSIRVNGIECSQVTIKKIYLSLDDSHIRYVMDCLNNNTTQITNIRSYIITSLYNSYLTMKTYYKTKVNHDLYGMAAC